MALRIPEAIEKHRILAGPLASDPSLGANGAFFVRRSPRLPMLLVIVSDGMGWEHVSVSLPTRCPTWNEMAWVKAQFWEQADTVMQLHPPVEDYANMHPFCLHLWRPTDAEIPRPPSLMVGIRNVKGRP